MCIVNLFTKLMANNLFLFIKIYFVIMKQIYCLRFDLFNWNYVNYFILLGNNE